MICVLYWFDNIFSLTYIAHVPLLPCVSVQMLYVRLFWLTIWIIKIFKLCKERYIFVSFVCLCFSVCACAPRVYRYPRGPEEGVQSPGSGVTVDCELLDVGAEGLNLGSLKEK